MVKDKEEVVYITSLATALHTLNKAIDSPLYKFGQFGSSGNKAWTLFARAASGSFWWRLQARLRVISNAVELFTDKQKAQSKAMLEQADRYVELGTGMKNIQAVTSDFPKIEAAISALTAATGDAIPIFEKLKENENFGDLFTGLAGIHGDVEGFEILKDMYLGAEEKFEDSQKRMSMSFSDYWKDRIRDGLKFADKFGNIYDEAGWEAATYGEKFKSVMDKIEDFSWEGIEAIFGSDGVMGEGIKTVKDTFAGMGRMTYEITDRIQGQHGDSGTKTENAWDPKSKLGKGVAKIFSGGVVRNIMAFFALGSAFLVSAALWGTAIVIGILLIVALLRATWKYFKEAKPWFEELFALFAASARLVWAGVSDLLTAIWEGDILGAILAIWTKILPGLLGMLLSVVMAILSGMAIMLGALIVGIMDAVVTLGDVLAKKIGLHASGGTVNTPLQIVGEKGPELVSLPQGSQVHSNAESQKMGGNVINITVSGHMGSSDADIRRLADKLGNEINRRVNRTSTSSTGF